MIDEKMKLLAEKEQINTLDMKIIDTDRKFVDFAQTKNVERMVRETRTELVEILNTGTETA
jgi:hypothetical protein